MSLTQPALNSAPSPSVTVPRGVTIGYWLLTVPFLLLMTFSAYAYLAQPMMAEGFHHLGFPDYFRIELAIAKLLGVAVLLIPGRHAALLRLQEWAYAGFGITLISAFIAHFTIDGPAKAIAPLIALAMLAASYALRLRRIAAA